MAGSCYIKQAESILAEIEAKADPSKPKPNRNNGLPPNVQDFYRKAFGTFDALVEIYRDSDPKLRAQTLYWSGDVAVRCGDYEKAYRNLKRTVFEYPETEWARRARGLLLQEGRNFKDFD